MIKKNAVILTILLSFSFLIHSGTITVTKPALGNDWVKGETYNITWNASGCTDTSIKINIFKDSTLQSNFVEQLTCSNCSSYSWKIPLTYTAGNYQIRVKTSDNLCVGDSGVFQIVDPDPSVITVTSPVTGDNWDTGTKHDILWDKEGPMGSSVKITLHKYYTGTGISSTISATISSSTPNDGKYSWTLPSTLYSGDYAIRVQTTDNKVSDYSEVFSIQGRSSSYTRTVSGVSKLKGPVITKRLSLPKPDLGVSIKFDSPNTFIGRRSKVIFTVQNSGLASSKATMLKVGFNNKETKSWHVPQLNRIQHTEFSLTWTPDIAGTITWFAKVDSQNTMGDTNRTNNSVTKDIIVLPINLPDLIVCVKEVGLMTPMKPTLILFKVKNIGTYKSAACKIKISVGRRKNKYYDIPILLPGSTHTVNHFALFAMPGPINIKATVDYKSKIAELNENNNKIDSFIMVLYDFEKTTDTLINYKCSDGSKF